jgi:DNA helicase HerA-like ATPase
MQVAGITNQQEVYVVSEERPFKINQMLIIEDELQGSLRGEVVETTSYNKYIPLNINGEMADKQVLESLRCLGYNVDDNTMYIARVRLMVEGDYPVATGSEVRLPEFEEVCDLLVKSEPEDGLILGVIKSTEELEDTLNQKLKGLFAIMQDGVIKDQQGVPFIFDIRSMQQYPHIGIFGGSGSGKSFGMRVILEEVMKLNIPCVVLDPHYEMDFTSSSSGLKEKYKTSFGSSFKCLQIGKHVGVRFTDLSTRDLISLIGAASTGGLTDPMTNVVEQLYRSKKDTYFTFENRLSILSEALDLGNEKKISDKLDNAQDDLDRQRYSQMVEIYRKYNSLPGASVKGVQWRLQRLYKEGLFTNDISAIENCLREGKTAVVQGPVKLINVFSAYLIGNLYHKRRDYRDSIQLGEKQDFFPPFILALDESHNFAPKGYESSAKSIIKEISQEGRKYGVFLIMATQRPALLDETVTAQLNTKLVFRTVRGSDIETIKEETDITSEEAKRLPYLRSGDTFISSAIFGRTISVRIRMAKTTTSHTENPFDELKGMMNRKDEELYGMIKPHLPVYPNDYLSLLGKLEEGAVKDVEALKSLMEVLCQKGYITRKKTVFGECYEDRQ